MTSICEGTITDLQAFVHSSGDRSGAHKAAAREFAIRLYWTLRTKTGIQRLLTSRAARDWPWPPRARPQITNKLNLLRISFTSGKIRSAKPDCVPGIQIKADAFVVLNPRKMSTLISLVRRGKGRAYWVFSPRCQISHATG